jgi:alkylated DNA repair dioxygenase AlkB
MNNQGSLFEEPDALPRSLEINVLRNAIASAEATDYFTGLMAEVEWKQESVKMFGKVIDVPRLTAWYGDPDRSYTYSGIALTPTAWSPLLSELRALVERLAGCEFNSVLLNLYRSGSDSVSWHADDEPDLGREPIIGSLSLGAARSFSFRKKTDHADKHSFVLNSGDVVVMRGITQQIWDHQIPKEPKVLGPRINLTFRQILNKS